MKPGMYWKFPFMVVGGGGGGMCFLNFRGLTELFFKTTNQIFIQPGYFDIFVVKNILIM